ncbi:high-affinity branched-chain amino acid ABC transporter permease LivM [Serratia odorifera]
MKLNLLNAVIATLVLLVMASFLMGMQLSLEGTRLVVHGAAEVRWMWIGIGCAVVFFFQLLRPLMQQGLGKMSGPSWVLPSFDGTSTTLRQKLLAALLIIAAVAWPFFVSRGTVDIATLTLIYVMLGLGLNVVVGLSGLLVLGYGGFYAIGAYTYALLNHYYGLGFWESLPLAGIVTAAFGFLLGFPVLRLRGDYLAIVTLGFGEIVRILLLNNTDITGGPNGISQIPKPTLFGLEFSRSARDGGWDTFHNFFGLQYDPSDRIIFLYLVALLLVVLTLFVINRLLRMPLGRAWEALREDEIACRSLGLSPTKIKLTAFTISAAFAGFAGTLFAARQGFVSPESFTFVESAFVLAIVVLGGMGSQFAVILAAILLVVSREMMRDLNEYSMLLLGALMVLMMIWRPQGLLPMKRPQLKLKAADIHAVKGERP